MQRVRSSLDLVPTPVPSALALTTSIQDASERSSFDAFYSADGNFAVRNGQV
jgi:hypothetical protein